MTPPPPPKKKKKKLITPQKNLSLVQAYEIKKSTHSEKMPLEAHYKSKCLIYLLVSHLKAKSIPAGPS